MISTILLSLSLSILVALLTMLIVGRRRMERELREFYEEIQRAFEDIAEHEELYAPQSLDFSPGDKSEEDQSRIG